MKNKAISKNISILAMVSSLMFLFGIIFESIIPIGALGTFVNPSPVEALLFVPIYLFGIASSLLAAATYITLLIIFKGFSLINIISIISLFLSMVVMIIVLSLLKNKFPFLIISTISIIVLTIIMIITNALFITPTFLNLAKQPFSFYWDVALFKDFNFFQMIWYVIVPFPLGGGILHGNIIKYILVFVIGKAIISFNKIP